MADFLAKPHAEKRWQDGECGKRQMLDMKSILRSKAGGKCKGGNGEGKAECLHQIVSAKTQRLDIGHSGYDENSGAAGQKARHQPHDGGEFWFQPCRYRDRSGKQAVGCVNREAQAER